MNTTKYHLSTIEDAVVDIGRRLQSAFPNNLEFMDLHCSLTDAFTETQARITEEELKGNSQAARTLKRVGLIGLNKPRDLFQVTKDEVSEENPLADTAYIAKQLKVMLGNLKLTRETQKTLPVYYHPTMPIEKNSSTGLYQCSTFGLHDRLLLHIRHSTLGQVTHHLLLEFNTTVVSGEVVLDSYYYRDFSILSDLPWEDGFTYVHHYWELFTHQQINRILQQAGRTVKGEFNITSR